MKAFDVSGQRFGRLVAVAPERVGAVQMWRCVCDCGNETRCVAGSLRSGRTSSCGCLRRDMVAAKNFRHGHTAHPLWSTWNAMLGRCEVEGHPQYHLYGARGIRVCDRWHDFAAFVTDMGTRPSPHHSLDRVDNDGNYELSNVRWATPAEQARNTRQNVFVEVNGERMCLKDAARVLGVPYTTVRTRHRKGLPLDERARQ